MASMEEQILRVAKEIVVKFIETGRVSPTAFDDTFKKIYRTVVETVDTNHFSGNTASDPETKPKK